jgi:hypothetical protein
MEVVKKKVLPPSPAADGEIPRYDPPESQYVFVPG